MGRQIIEMTGEKVGNWTVLGESGRKNGGVLWNCQCSCGVIEKLRSIELTSRRRLACLNCSKSERLLPPGQSGLNNLYEKYKQSSFRRGHDFSLSKDFFKIMTSSNCYYCGREPEQSYNGRGKTTSTKEHGRYAYNGLDRTDNSVGYLEDNVKPCCKWCNQAKHTMSESDFFKLIDSVYNIHIKK